MTKQELELILQEGEGYRIEFKEGLSNLDREMVAFANSEGGRILVGISDRKEIGEITITGGLKSRIQDIANNCDPAIPILFDEADGVLIVDVREGADKPYQCSGGFYVRIGPNTQKLDRDGIIEFMKEEGKIKFDQLHDRRFLFDEHFDPKKLRKYLRLAGISEVLDIPSILVNLGVAEKQEGRVLLNNTGILFFAHNLGDVYFHTTVTCALFKGTDKAEVLDRRDYNEDIVSSIDGAMVFMRQHLSVRYEMTGEPRRREVPEVPFEALREAVINAVTHRDYFERGANVMVEIYDDRIEITNPGGLVKGLKPDEFGTRSALRNPNIANLLQRIEYIERMGTGIAKMRRLMVEAGLPPPEFRFSSFFSVRFERPARKRRAGTAAKRGAHSARDDTATDTVSDTISDAISNTISDGINDGISDGMRKRLAWIVARLAQAGFVTRRELEKQFSVSRPTAERYLALLKQANLIGLEGARKTGRYVLTERGKKLLAQFSDR
jgi:ATP-dependent DNA helicase RecG